MRRKLVRGQMIEIITMRKEHAAQIAALEVCCFSLPWSAASIEAELDNPLSLWLVAICGPEVCGYIGSQTVLPESDMLNLAVAPKWRRQHVGEALVRQLCAALQRQGSRSLTLEVRASNLAAKALYLSQGFQLVGTRRNYYKKPAEDAELYRKELEQNEDSGSGILV